MRNRNIYDILMLYKNLTHCHVKTLTDKSADHNLRSVSIMKNGMKRILGIIVFLSLFAFSGKAVLTSYAASSGSCGENLAWTLSDDGTLTISGEGAMDKYMDISEQPWGSQRNSIKRS